MKKFPFVFFVFFVFSALFLLSACETMTPNPSAKNSQVKTLPFMTMSDISLALSDQKVLVIDPVAQDFSQFPMAFRNPSSPFPIDPLLSEPEQGVTIYQLGSPMALNNPLALHQSLPPSNIPQAVTPEPLPPMANSAQLSNLRIEDGAYIAPLNEVDLMDIAPASGDEDSDRPFLMTGAEF
jgi:hypothetical protein